MASDFDEQEPSIDMEAVERRGEPRGIMRDLYVTVGVAGRCEVLEASRKGFFVCVADPDAFRLRDSLDIEVERGDRMFGCRVEVIRKEVEPRVGVALRISHITPVAEETLKLMLEA